MLKIINLLCIIVIFNLLQQSQQKYFRHPQKSLKPTTEDLAILKLLQIDQTEENKQNKQIIVPLEQKEQSFSKKIENYNFIKQQNNHIMKLSDTTVFRYDKVTKKIKSQVEKINKDQLLLAQLKSTTKDIPTLDLLNHMNMFYTGLLGVSDPNKTFVCIWDTGSTLIWVNSVYCGSPGCELAPQYNSDDSETHDDTLRDNSIQYGAGYIEGPVGIDTVFLGDMAVPNMSIIEVSGWDATFADGSLHGLVGLSYPSLSDGEDTIIDRMIGLNLIDEPIFSFYMDRESDTKDSKLIFGGIDESLMVGDLNYHSVSEKMFWSIECHQILVGDEDTEICTQEQPCKFVIDSGTSLLTAPSIDLEILYEYLSYYQPLEDLQQGYNIDQMQPNQCRGLLTLPDITFVMDGVKYPITANDFIISLSYDGEINAYSHPDGEEIIDCMPSFIAFDFMEPVGPLWIIGNIFMSRYFTVFDRGQDRIGLAKAAGMDHP